MIGNGIAWGRHTIIEEGELQRDVPRDHRRRAPGTTTPLRAPST